MYQSVTIVGHLGRDPEMRYLQSGDAVTSFSVATSRKWKAADGSDKEEVVWWKVTAWKKLAEITNQYLTKGSLVMVVGTAKVSAYTDKSGQPAASLELRADTVKFLSKRGDAETGEAAPSDEDSVPF